MRLTIGVILNEQLRIGWHVVNWDAVQLAGPVVFQRPEHTPERLTSHIHPHIIGKYISLSLPTGSQLSPITCPRLLYVIM